MEINGMIGIKYNKNEKEFIQFIHNQNFFEIILLRL